MQREVAIKIIRHGMESSRIIARFEAERQALAMMRHPNIATVLDAGRTSDGWPYFVMELVEGQPLDALAADLRDRSIFPGFDLAEVKRARITGGGKVLVVDRGSDSEWKVVEPARGPAKARKVDNVLLTLKSMRWKDIAPPEGQDAARYGLDKPELEVTLAKSGDAPVGTLLVGKRDGDVSYVRLKTGPAIYAVDDKLVADLRKASTDIPG